MNDWVIEKIQEFLTIKLEQYPGCFAKEGDIEGFPEKEVRTHSLDDLLAFAQSHSQILSYDGRYIPQSNVILFDVKTPIDDDWALVFEGEIHITPEVIRNEGFDGLFDRGVC